MTIYASFAIVGFVLLLFGVAAISGYRMTTSDGEECRDSNWLFHACVVCAGIAGLGVGGILAALAAPGGFATTLLIVSSAMLHASAAHTFIPPMLRGNPLT